MGKEIKFTVQIESDLVWPNYFILGLAQLEVVSDYPS